MELIRDFFTVKEIDMVQIDPYNPSIKIKNKMFMNNLTKIILKPGKEKSLLRFHPWVFSGAIKKIEGLPKEGDIVEVKHIMNKYQIKKL